MPPNLPERDHTALRAENDLAAEEFRRAFQRLRGKAGFDPDQPRVPAGNPSGGQWTRVGVGTGRRVEATTSARRKPTGSTAPEAPRKPVSAGKAPNGIEVVEATFRATSRGRAIRDTSGREAWERYSDVRRADGSVAGRAVDMRDGSRILEAAPANGEVVAASHIVKPKDGAPLLFRVEDGVQTVRDASGNPLLRSEWTNNGPVRLPVSRPAAISGHQLQDVEQAGAVLYNWLSTSNSSERRACLASGP